jgi:hypothetical protein
MPQWALPICFVLGYIVVMKYVLPRFGLTT